MKVFNLEELMSAEDLQNLHDKASSIQWISNIPGGFVTNSPQRKVFTFGTGEGINNDGNLNGLGALGTTYWTPKMCASNCALYSIPNEMPAEFTNLILLARSLFKKTMTNVFINEYTFNIAVCNYYTDYDMNISPHTDCNMWYPAECEEGPVFASLTLYPCKKPMEDPKEFARFGVKVNHKWQQVNLPHNSLAIIPSSLEHRVQPHTKKNAHCFCPRINITFRSSYHPSIDPLRHRMATSNHTRYYSYPIAIRVPNCVNIAEVEDQIIQYYNVFLKQHGKPPLLVIRRNFDKKILVSAYKKKFNICKLMTTMVPETFYSILQTID
tara:strand:+ start:365 stop:1339 length:975 start_codon:yes stop_codon:yes gene_type:complete